jgi:sugar/nucleoside kinase (ribokinase family)
MPDFDVVVVGELNPDLVLSGDVTPRFGQVEQLLDAATLTVGSSSAIFACGAARLGLRAAFIGKVGDDEFGDFMRRSLAARGIDTSGIVTDPSVKTGLSVILSRGNDRAILTFSGAIGALRYAEVDQPIVARARHLHIGSYFMLEALRPDIARLFDDAHNSGLTTSLDTNYDPAEAWDGGLSEVLRRTDAFLPNETELRAIARISDTSGALEALGQHVPLIAVKRGAQGGIARRENEIFQSDSIPVTVVDTTGAGDSFDAGFIYGYLNGWETARALRLACVCGALSTRAAGGTDAQATLTEAMERL